MKIHALQSNIYQKYEKYSVGLCEQDNKYKSVNTGLGINTGLSKGHRASSDVTFTSSKPLEPPKELKKLGKTFWDKIGGSEKFNKLLIYFAEKISVMQAGVALIVAGMLRPATNMAMASKEDRDDAKYAASHAISSAVIGFIISTIVLKPFDDAYKKFKNDPKKYLSDSYNKYAKPFLEKFDSNDADNVITKLNSDEKFFQKLSAFKTSTNNAVKKLDKHIDIEKIDKLEEELRDNIKHLYREKFPKCNEEQLVALTEFDKYIDKYSTQILRKNSRELKEFLETHTKINETTKTIFGVGKVGSRQLGKSNSYKNICKIMQMLPDTLVLGIPKAMLTIALIPPILKYVFGMEKKQPKPPVTNNFIDKPIFQAFKGGVK